MTDLPTVTVRADRTCTQDVLTSSWDDELRADLDPGTYALVRVGQRPPERWEWCGRHNLPVSRPGACAVSDEFPGSCAHIGWRAVIEVEEQ